MLKWGQFYGTIKKPKTKGILTFRFFMEEILQTLTNCKNVDNFVEFYKFFKENALKFNLTSILDEKEVCVKHFFDSLQGEKFLTENANVVEIGSGGGFPSVPLKIERKDLKFTLIEATEKKCAYLKGVGELLNFENFDVVNGRCEELGKTLRFREVFDFAVARAVAPLNVLVEYLTPFLKVGGKALCYKGSSFKEEVENAKNALDVLGCKVMDEYEYDLPDSYGKRAIVVIEKKKPTPFTYPRTQAKIKKAPL